MNQNFKKFFCVFFSFGLICKFTNITAKNVVLIRTQNGIRELVWSKFTLHE